MSELPEGWADTSVKAVCELLNGKAYQQDELLVAGKYPVLRVGNFFSNRSWYYSDLELEDQKYCDDGDLLYAWSASFGPKIWTGGKVIYHYHIWRVDIEPRLVEKRFMFHWFEWDKENIKADLGTGSTMMHVTKGGMEARSLCLPPLPEQRRIVAKVDGLTARTARARKELNRIPTLIARYKQRLLALAFSGELTAGWRADHGHRKPVPTAVDDLAEGLRYGTAQKCYAEPNGVAVLRIPNVASGRISFDDLKYAVLEPKELSKLRLDEGDILVVRSNGSVDLVGRPALVTGDAVGLAYAGYLIRIRPRLDVVLPKFLTLMLEAPAIRSIIESGARSTSGVNNVNATELGALAIPLFDIQEQAEIVRRIESAFGWLDRMAADHAAAARLLPKLDAAILAKAFRGELVPQDPDDEPASVLLERIKPERETGNGSRIGKIKSRVRHRKVQEITNNWLEPTAAQLGSLEQQRRSVTMAINLMTELILREPYLSDLLKASHVCDVQGLFKIANMPVTNFYKQLSWEIDQGYIVDSPHELKAA